MTILPSWKTTARSPHSISDARSRIKFIRSQIRTLQLASPIRSDYGIRPNESRPLPGCVPARANSKNIGM